MRLLTFELSAYGSFKDRTLDFSASKAGMHLVYGPNEAGKSVALRALTGFFFGIPSRTGDNFIHPNARLRIGAKIIHSDGSELYAIRRKGQKDTLLNHSGDPIPEAALGKYLEGMNRDLFSTMYAMDHEILVAGGKALVAGGGDVGQSLFAAGMGVADMRGLVEALESEAGSLFKPTGKNPKINRLIQDFKSLKHRCANKSLSSKEWISHNESLDFATKEKEIVGRELLKLSSERHRLERLHQAIPRIARLLALRAEMKEMGEVRRLPPEFSKQRRETENILHRSQSTEARVRKDLENIQRELSRISPEGSLIKAQEEIRALFLRSGSHKKAMMDLPKRMADKERLLEEAQAILKKLGPAWELQNADSRRLTDALVARIRKLGRELDPILERRAAAKRLSLELESEILTAKEDLSHMPSEKDPERLKAALNRILKQGDLSERLNTINGHLREHQENLDALRKGLGFWEGSLDALEGVNPPQEETIDQFESDFAAGHSKLERADQALCEQRERLFGLERQMEALKAAGSIPKVSDLEQARKHRDEGWRLVMKSWLEPTSDKTNGPSFDAEVKTLAEEYEKRVRTADEIADRLRNESERVAKQASLMADRQEVEKRIVSLSEALEGLQEEHLVLERAWNKLWENVGISPRKPREMRAWLQRYHKLVEEMSYQRTLMENSEGLETLIKEHKSVLNKHLKALGETPVGNDENLDSFLNRCEAVGNRIEDARKKRENLIQHLRDLDRKSSIATHNLEQAEEALKSWQKMWGQAVEHLALESSALPAEADAVLDRIQALFDRMDQASMMQSRVQAMERDAEEFSNWVGDLCSRLAPDLNKKSPETAARELNERLDKALADTARFQELEKQQRSLVKAIQVEEIALEESQAKLAEMCREAGVGSYEELPEIEERSDLFREKQEKIEALEQELVGYSAGAGIEALIQETEEMNADALPAEMEALDRHIQAMEGKRSELDQLIGRERAVLAGMDGRSEAAELAEKSQGILADLRDAVERYARVTVSALLLRKEIERYREANQGPILKRAGEIFAAITLNSFKGLVPDFDHKDNPILIGVRPTKEKVSVEGMSDGTSDQLYLALRLASLEQRLLDGEPMPLILDDILINFDDDRSCATLKVLEALSKKTQIIFFTHHRRILELARANVRQEALVEHYL